MLFRLLATTGMRLGEAFQIDGEEPKEKGCRFVIIGRKTPQSRRRVPLPADVLAHLPGTIKGPLFKGDASAASKRLNRFLRDIGIVDSRKVIHSLRTGEDRLRPPSARRMCVGRSWAMRKRASPPDTAKALPSECFANGSIRSGSDWLAGSLKRRELPLLLANAWADLRSSNITTIGLLPRRRAIQAVGEADGYLRPAGS